MLRDQLYAIPCTLRPHATACSFLIRDKGGQPYSAFILELFRADRADNATELFDAAMAPTLALAIKDDSVANVVKEGGEEEGTFNGQKSRNENEVVGVIGEKVLEEVPQRGSFKHVVVANIGLHFSDSFADETAAFTKQLHYLAAALHTFNKKRGMFSISLMLYRQVK